jgi:flagellar hook protein FlgE
MLRAMYSGVSGLMSQEEMLDVIGNNIANVNTTGFKGSSIEFADVLSQTIQGAVQPQNQIGGTNAAQVGLGVEVSGIGTDFTQGADQQTGRSTDLAIEGNGFFIGNLGGQPVYTRNGAFSFDANGELVNPDGAIIQGWMADSSGTINTNGPTTSLIVPTGESIAPVATGSVTIGGNLPTSPTVDSSGKAVIDTSINVYDAQGTAIPLTFEFTYTAGSSSSTPGSWSVQAKDAGGNTIGSSQALTFDGSGNLTAPTNYSVSLGSGSSAQTVNVNFASTGQPLVEYGGTATVSIINQNGSPAGTLQSVAVGKSGVISGVFSNGESKVLGQVALASFSNPSGLEKQGGSLYAASANSGIPMLGTAGSGGRGNISSGVLEGSNVDLSKAFSDLIIAQRGFEANTKVISTSDQILSELINMKQ